MKMDLCSPYNSFPVTAVRYFIASLPKDNRNIVHNYIYVVTFW